jgi:hypothetical protein
MSASGGTSALHEHGARTPEAVELLHRLGSDEPRFSRREAAHQDWLVLTADTAAEPDAPPVEPAEEDPDDLDETPEAAPDEAVGRRAELVVNLVWVAITVARAMNSVTARVTTHLRISRIRRRRAWSRSATSARLSRGAARRPGPGDPGIGRAETSVGVIGYLGRSWLRYGEDRPAISDTRETRVRKIYDRSAAAEDGGRRWDTAAA